MVSTDTTHSTSDLPGASSGDLLPSFNTTIRPNISPSMTGVTIGSPFLPVKLDLAEGVEAGVVAPLLVHLVPLVSLPPVLVPIPLNLSGFGPNLPTIHPEGQPLGLVKAQPPVPDLPDPYLLAPLQCLQLISFILPATTGLSPLNQFTILVT